MDDALEQEVVEEYPEFFEYYGADMENPAPNISLFGFECDDGWVDIIESVCETLDRQDISLQFVQVKEKFGGLRMYYQNVDVEDESQAHVLHSAVKMAETMSFRTCEVCGNRGELRDDDGWYKTRCNDCFNNS